MSDPKNAPLSDDHLFNTIRSSLDDCESQVDDEVCHRLRQARREAVRVACERQSRHAPVTRWLVPAGGFTVLLLAAVISFVIGTGAVDSRPPIDQSSVASTEDLPLLTSPDSLELYEELDFYQWLEEEQADVG